MDQFDDMGCVRCPIVVELMIRNRDLQRQVDENDAKVQAVLEEVEAAGRALVRVELAAKRARSA